MPPCQLTLHDYRLLDTQRHATPHAPADRSAAAFAGWLASAEGMVAALVQLRGAALSAETCHRAVQRIAGDPRTARRAANRLVRAAGLAAAGRQPAELCPQRPLDWAAVYRALWRHARISPRRAGRLSLDDAALLLGVDTAGPQRRWLSLSEAHRWMASVAQAQAGASPRVVQTAWCQGLVRWWHAAAAVLDGAVRRPAPHGQAPRDAMPDPRSAPSEALPWVVDDEQGAATLLALVRRQTALLESIDQQLRRRRRGPFLNHAIGTSC